MPGRKKNAFSPETLFAMLEASYDGLTYTDETGTIRYFNQAYTRITGITEEEMLGKNIYEQAEKGYPISNIVLQVFEEKTTLSRIIRYRPDAPDEALVTIVPLFDGGGVFRGIVGNVRDMTGLIDLRRRLSLMQADFSRTLERKELENQLLREQIAHAATDLREYDVVGRSPQMRRLVELAFRVSNTSSTVLITGESGVGKDVFCKLIHQFSGHTTPYTKISCGAIPENLLESELFGYEAGAFTGAGRGGKPGILEVAGDGTVFLDEVGELPPHLQVKLLTVLQDRRFYRIGGTREKIFQARVIAATNRDLKAEMERGNFRADLYYRLSVIPVHLPPLRERKEDILPLAGHMLEQLEARHGPRKQLTTAVQDALLAYDWPGNIRELNNVVERMYVLSPGDILEPDSLPEELRAGLPGHASAHHAGGGLLHGMMEDYERTLLHEHLKSGRPLAEIAETLGIDLSTLLRKLTRYGLPRRYKKRNSQSPSV